MFAKIFLAALVLASKAAATIFYAGVAESGGEFGVYSLFPPTHYEVIFPTNQMKAAQQHPADLE